MILLKVASLLVLPICSPMLGLPDPAPTQVVAPVWQVSVFFTNHAYFDAQVSAVQAGVDNVPMGLVRAFSTVRRQLPEQIVRSGREVQFLLEPISGRESHMTDAIIVAPGDEVTVTIENDLDLSTVSVQQRYELP